jgi:hypothetical protein
VNGRRLRTLAMGGEYSLGIYSGQTPFDLTDAQGASNPVLTRASVTDANAVFVADPFMTLVDGTWHMFFEALVRGPEGAKGVIALATSKDARSWSYQRIVLSEAFHLSYPYVFESGGEFFMIPESSSAGGVRLYQADPFPSRWVFKKTLVSGPTHFDSSILEHDNRWWMFTDTGSAPRFDTLRLLQSRTLFGPWTEHPASPIVERDARLARPAGRVIATREGRILRFAQDCSSSYGASVRALEITRLTPSSYAETQIAGDPILEGSGTGWNGQSMHQVDPHELTEGGWIACVDGLSTHVRHPREFAWWAVDRLRSMRRSVLGDQPDGGPAELK